MKFHEEKSMAFRVMVSLVAALGVALLATAGFAAPAAQEEVAVAVGDNVFEPQTLTVAVGTTVTWNFVGARPHTVTADDESYDSGILNAGATFSHEYTEEGTFGYHCELHGQAGGGMFGTIIVTADGSEPAAPAEPSPTSEPAVEVSVPPSSEGISVTITSPAEGTTVSGSEVTVTVDVQGTTLVPGAQATSLDQMHIHYLLDVDPAPYLDGGMPFPTGQSNIVHTASSSATFTDVAPGTHTVYVVLGLSSHQVAQPPVAPMVTFTVSGTASQPVVQIP